MAWPAVSQASAYPVCAYVGPPQEKLTALGSPALAFPVCSSDGAPSLAAMTKPSAMALTAHEAYSFLACAFRPACYSGCAFSQVPFFVRPASSCAAMPFFFASLLVLAWPYSYPACCGLRVVQLRFCQSKTTRPVWRTRSGTCTLKIYCS